MSADKKHPLEVFRSSGRPLSGMTRGSGADAGSSESVETGGAAEQAPAPTAGETHESARRPHVRGARPLSDFEMRLTLPGSLVLLFVWLVLMGAAYMYGHSRGSSQGATDQQNQALAKGRQIEQGSRESLPVGAGGGSSRAKKPYGVVLITYQGAQLDKIDEMNRILRERYGIEDRLYPWKLESGKVEVFLGAYATSDDSNLARLLAAVRRIDDWPSGNDRTPFETAYRKVHPRIP